MKKLLLLLFIGIIGIGNAQTFKENFLGEDFMQYKGALLKLKDNPISKFSYKFYSDLEYCQNPYDRNVIYPDIKYSFSTVKDSLSNRTFKVEDIVGKDGGPFSGRLSLSNKPILVLKDTKTGQTIYYVYGKKYDYEFPFLVSGIEIDAAVFCAKIERKADDFTDELSFHSPSFNGSQASSMTINKYIKGSDTDYYLSLRAYGASVSVGETGVIILFQDGTKMNKPSEEIDVDAGENGYTYSAWITLTAAEVESFSVKTIKKFRLYIYDKEVSPSEADKFTHYAKCIVDKKN
tara:strand:- start:292 stop:1164 length:873 start_codon:yes stop_codon:yes gene_type:complete